MWKSCYNVGVSLPFQISHLQFANDTLIMGEKKSWRNIKSLKENLILFKIVFGLKVNFRKSLLVGVNMADLWLLEATVVLNCKISQIPFVYLGLPIGRDRGRLMFWHRLIKNMIVKFVVASDLFFPSSRLPCV